MADQMQTILRYDYSGYGQSTGKPSEQNTYADIEAAYKCLEGSYGAKQEDIILYGQSIGSGPTLDLAARLPQLRVVVLHSAILSGIRVLYPVKRTYQFDIYKNIDKIPLVSCPVLIIHIPFRRILAFQAIGLLANRYECKSYKDCNKTNTGGCEPGLILPNLDICNNYNKLCCHAVELFLQGTRHAMFDQGVHILLVMGLVV